MSPPPNTPKPLLANLPTQAPRRRWVWALVLVALLLPLAWWVWGLNAQPKKPTYITEPLARGDITLTVTANGTLQPVRQVNVGSELSGTVQAVRVDVNERVQRGQVLIELDPAKLKDQVQHARAALAAAQAQQTQAEATARETQAQLVRLEALFERSEGGIPSKTDMDAARATAARSQAAVLSAKALVDQARATLATNTTNLSKAAIVSPMDGVVLSRQVDPGNAVAASLQAVTLLTIAQDLRRMTLAVNVDEADVGVLQTGQAATFTVSSYPARRYPGTVQRVAYGSTKTDNVVTYTTTLDVDNSDLTLRPGMTATASIVAVERNNVWRVPNAALRFMPTASTNRSAPSLMSQMMPRPPTASPKTARLDRRSGARQVWVLDQGEPRAIAVVTGISDGRMTEVSGEGLLDGLPIITEQRAAP
ncbi:MAG: Macrolide export protein MacA [Pseudomonadota bacterium]